MSKIDQVAYALIRMVTDHKLARGTRLPPLRTIAAENGVSVFAAKKAMDRLIDEGLVESRVGDGCYVASTSERKLRTLARELDRRIALATRRRLARRSPAQDRFVGVLIGETSGSFYGGFLKGISAVLARESFRCDFSLNNWSMAMETAHVQSMLSSPGLRGLIVDPAGKRECPPYFEDLVRTQTPTVFIGDVRFPEADRVDVMRCDNRAGMALAMEHVLALGHRRVAYVEYALLSIWANTPRYETCRDALAAAGGEPPPRIGLSLTDEPHRIAQLKAAMAKPKTRPTALVCFNDILALWTIRALATLSLRVPDDVSVCGFDDREMVENMQPSLTTVHYPREDIGTRAAQRIVAKAAGTVAADETACIEVAPHLVVRESCAPPRKG